MLHGGFPPGRVHALDYSRLPSPDALELLLRVRRSNRALTARPVPAELLDRIVAAMQLAPTASNARGLGYAVVTDPEKLRAVADFTMEVFTRLVRLLKCPPVRFVLKPLAPGLYRYVPAFDRMRRSHAEGGDPILRKATALVAIHAPRGSRFGAEDANLAYQNGSLMAEALGVSQIYMGFVLTAVRRRPGVLERMLGVEGRICAVMALGMPAFRFPNGIDRGAAPVTRR